MGKNKTKRPKGQKLDEQQQPEDFVIKKEFQYYSDSGGPASEPPLSSDKDSDDDEYWFSDEDEEEEQPFDYGIEYDEEEEDDEPAIYDQMEPESLQEVNLFASSFPEAPKKNQKQQIKGKLSVRNKLSNKKPDKRRASTSNGPSTSLQLPNQIQQNDLKKRKKCKNKISELEAQIPKNYDKTIISWCGMTHYNVIKEVLKFDFDFTLTKFPKSKPWDLAWWDGPPPLSMISKVMPWQRVNHYPGIDNLARKNLLGKHLMRMRKQFPSEYNFFPLTYMLPQDYKEFYEAVGTKRNRTFICKPEASCQGKGIFLCRNPEQLQKMAEEQKISQEKNSQPVIDKGDHYVVQRYLTKPYLIDGYKFDLRLYVLINGISPLRMYMYKDGLARFATVPYKLPAPSNMNNLCMHLTNYAINKDQSNFQQNAGNDAEGSKRSYLATLEILKKLEGEEAVKKLEAEINDIIVKTVCISQPHIFHLYRSCQPDDLDNQICFQILGFDIMVDRDMKPYLVEVNQMPSFQTDSDLDYRVKKGVIHDTLNLLNLNYKRRWQTQQSKDYNRQARLACKFKQPDTTKIQSEEPSTKRSGVNPNQLSQSAANLSTQTTQNTLSVLGDKQKSLIAQALDKKAQQMTQKEELKLTKRLWRERYEYNRKGDYMLLHPVISYQEEEFCYKALEVAQKQAVAKLKQNPNLTNIEIPTEDSMAKVINTVKQEQESQQQGMTNNPLLNFDELEERWVLHKKYDSFMEGAKCLWENFISGSVGSSKYKESMQRRKVDKEVLEAQQEIEKARKKNIARKELLDKLKVQEAQRQENLAHIKKMKEANPSIYGGIQPHHRKKLSTDSLGSLSATVMKYGDFQQQDEQSSNLEASLIAVNNTLELNQVLVDDQIDEQEEEDENETEDSDMEEAFVKKRVHVTQLIIDNDDQSRSVISNHIKQQTKLRVITEKSDLTLQAYQKESRSSNAATPLLSPSQLSQKGDLPSPSKLSAKSSMLASSTYTKMQMKQLREKTNQSQTKLDAYLAGSRLNQSPTTTKDAKQIINLLELPQENKKGGQDNDNNTHEMNCQTTETGDVESQLVLNMISSGEETFQNYNVSVGDLHSQQRQFLQQKYQVQRHQDEFQNILYEATDTPLSPINQAHNQMNVPNFSNQNMLTIPRSMIIKPSDNSPSNSSKFAKKVKMIKQIDVQHQPANLLLQGDQSYLNQDCFNHHDQQQSQFRHGMSPSNQHFQYSQKILQNPSLPASFQQYGQIHLAQSQLMHQMALGGNHSIHSINAVNRGNQQHLSPSRITKHRRNSLSELPPPPHQQHNQQEEMQSEAFGTIYDKWEVRQSEMDSSGQTTLIPNMVPTLQPLRNMQSVNGMLPTIQVNNNQSPHIASQRNPLNEPLNDHFNVNSPTYQKMQKINLKPFNPNGLIEGMVRSPQPRHVNSFVKVHYSPPAIQPLPPGNDAIDSQHQARCFSFDKNLPTIVKPAQQKLLQWGKQHNIINNALNQSSLAPNPQTEDPYQLMRQVQLERLNARSPTRNMVPQLEISSNEQQFRTMEPRSPISQIHTRLDGPISRDQMGSASKFRGAAFRHFTPSQLETAKTIVQTEIEKIKSQERSHSTIPNEDQKFTDFCKNSKLPLDQIKAMIEPLGPKPRTQRVYKPAKSNLLELNPQIQEVPLSSHRSPSETKDWNIILTQAGNQFQIGTEPDISPKTSGRLQTSQNNTIPGAQIGFQGGMTKVRSVQRKKTGAYIRPDIKIKKNLIAETDLSKTSPRHPQI